MVCATITRDCRRIEIDQVIAIRDALHAAIVKVMAVRPEDVEMRVRETSHLDVNSGALAIEIDTGPGKSRWRIESARSILIRLSAELVKSGTIPKSLRKKGVSNMWLRVFAAGASMPIGHEEHLH